MKLSILLADDEKSVREAIAVELSRAGYEVREARNGEEALGGLGGRRRFPADFYDMRELHEVEVVVLRGETIA